MFCQRMSHSGEPGLGISRMKWRLALLASITASCPAFSQERALATVRVTVRSEGAAVSGAAVTMNGASTLTDANGLTTATLPLGRVEIAISKEGFFLAKTSLLINEAREWQVAVDLKRQEKVE